MGTLLSNHVACKGEKLDGDPRGRNVSFQFTHLATWFLNKHPHLVQCRSTSLNHSRNGLASQTRFVWVLWLWGVSVYMCALHDLVPPTSWHASLNKWWRLKQSIQLVHVPLSSWRNAVLGTQLVCYYSITHSSAPRWLGSHVSSALDMLPAVPLQVWLTGLDLDGLPTSHP